MNHRNHDLITLPLILSLVTSCCLASTDYPLLHDDVSTESSTGLNASQDHLSDAAVARLEDHMTRVYPWSREEYPNPLVSPRYCRSMFPSNICDPDDILDGREKSQLDKTIRQLGDLKCYCDKCTTNTNGIGVGVALMKAMYKEYMVHPTNNTQSFAESLRQKWKLGLCDNDVVVLVSVNDRQWYPAIGGRLLRIISEDSLEEIKERTKKSFAEEQVFAGLQIFLQGIESTLRARSTDTRSFQDTLTFDDPDGPGDLAFFLGILFIAFLLIVLLCLVLYVYLVRNRKDDAQNKSPEDADAIEKKDALHFTSDGEDDDDVVVYDRSSTDDNKKSPFAWSDIRGKLQSHRKQPATDAEKAVLNEPSERNETPVDRQSETVAPVTEVKAIAPFSDDEIEHVDIENIHPVQVNEVYRETTVSITEDTASQ